jgi:ABC-type multidrug transport system fused ATPase/permease subunit
MARIGSETDRINVFLSLHLLDFATDVLMIAMTAAILFSINPWLALVTLVPLPFIAWLIHTGARPPAHRLREDRPRLGRGDQRAGRHHPRHPRGQGLRPGEREAERFRAANQHNLQVNDRSTSTWSLFSPTVTLLTEIGLLVVWAFGIWLVSEHEITVGVLTAFLAYIGRFYTRLDSMSRIVSVTQKAAAGAKRIFDILDHVSSVPEPVNPVKLAEVTRAASSCARGFRYGSRAVIADVSLDIEPGEMIGLVGHSGSGKSTLVNLICRFYDVTEGAIRVDGIDIRSLRRGRLPPPHRPGAAGALPVLRHHRREHRLRQARRHARRDHRRRPRRPRPRVHPAPAARLRLAGGRTRPGPVGRRAPAHLHRPRAADRPAHPDPRRGHLVGGHRDREGNPEGARQPGAGRTTIAIAHRLSTCARPTGWW